MKKRTFHFFFWFCLVVVLGVMGWLSVSMWNLENRREQELARTRLEETARLALWRMDSLLATLWAEENGRAPQEYFFITDRRTGRQSPLFGQIPAYARLYFQIDSEGGLSSPQISGDKARKGQESFSRDYKLLASSSVMGVLREIAGSPVKTIEEDLLVPESTESAPSTVHEKKQESASRKKPQGRAMDDLVLNQPQDQLRQAVLDYDSRFNLNKVNSAAVPRQQLQQEDSPFVNREKSRFAKEGKEKNLLAREVTGDSRKNGSKSKAQAPEKKLMEIAAAKEEDNANAGVQSMEDFSLADRDYFSMVDRFSDENEITLEDLRREKSGDSISSLRKGQEESAAAPVVEEETAELSLAETSLAVSAFVPRWVNGELFLLRTVTHASRKYVQGIWVDWNKMNGMLLASIADLLPGAKMLPLTNGGVTEENVSRTLAGLPLLIDPGTLPVSLEGKGISTLELSLAVAWFFALAAAAGAAFLLWGMVRLSERRATFVSAVTHELRTPLTTFNLYTEMLTEGLVPENKRPSYFATLRQEAMRLTHLVDNVLSFSRLEKSRPLRHPERISIGRLKEAVLRHIQPRLEGVGMEILTELSPEDAAREIRTDVTAVEQIMYNLADNAAKYAAAKDGHIVWRIRTEGKQLLLSFQDEGTGISGALRKRLFRPFSRSAEEAAGKKPGVGLGLALSREIARDLGGDLVLKETEGKGACFVLTLPLGV